jgi:hypothetical protein
MAELEGFPVLIWVSNYNVCGVYAASSNTPLLLLVADGYSVI